MSEVQLLSDMRWTELMQSGFFGRTIITIIVVATASYLIASGTIMPDWYQVVTATIIGYYFGTQPVTTIRETRQSNHSEEIK